MDTVALHLPSNCCQNSEYASFSARESNKTKTRLPVADLASTTADDSKAKPDTTSAVNEYIPLIVSVGVVMKKREYRSPNKVNLIWRCIIFSQMKSRHVYSSLSVNGLSDTEDNAGWDRGPAVTIPDNIMAARSLGLNHIRYIQLSKALVSTFGLITLTNI